MTALFQDRAEAGMTLADLAGRSAGPDTMVFGLGRGGVLLAAELARWSGAALDFLPLASLDLPCDEKTTIGAVGPGGVCVLDDELIDLLDLESDAIGTLRCEGDAAVDQLNRSLRGGRPLPDVRQRTVMLVDDVIASSLAIRAAALYLHQHAPRRVVVATPVVTRAARNALQAVVSELIAVDETETAPDIGRIYTNAATPTEAEVRRALGVSAALDEMPARSPMDDA